MSWREGSRRFLKGSGMTIQSLPNSPVGAVNPLSQFDAMPVEKPMRFWNSMGKAVQILSIRFQDTRHGPPHSFLESLQVVSQFAADRHDQGSRSRWSGGADICNKIR